jgi:hypothetical protein
MPEPHDQFDEYVGFVFVLCLLGFAIFLLATAI